MAKLKVHAGDFGKEGSNTLSKGTFMLMKPDKFYSQERIPAHQVETVEVANEEAVKRLWGTAGWGVAGAAVLGPLGLLAGLVAGGRGKDVTFVAKFKDGRKLMATVSSKEYTRLQAALF